MNPTLPSALIEREKYCDCCLNLVTEWAFGEIHGSTYTLCLECYAESLPLIRDSIARDMAGCDATERDQEGK